MNTIANNPLKHLRTLNRRQFMKLTGMAALFTAGQSLFPFPASHAASLPDSGFMPDVDILLEAAPNKVSLLPGPATYVWSYQGRVLTGPATALAKSKDSYLGPTFHFKRGQKVRIRFANHLPEPSIVHWHGLHIPALMDGHPRLAVPGGETYTYEFEVRNRPGTYWYHPHPHGRTGVQVYGGLAGLLIVSDEADSALELPSGDFDIPLVLQDRQFDADNQLVYLPNGMMGQMTGMMGETILVNGHYDRTIDVETRAYRFRLLNGSNARIYRLAWEDGTPLTVIGTDGGLLSRAVQKREVLLGPGERIELWTDFSGYPTGSSVGLISLPVRYNTVGTGMGGGMMRGNGRSESRPLILQRFHVARQSLEIQQLALPLAPLDFHSINDAHNASAPRRFRLAMNHMQGTINGRVFGMDSVADDEVIEQDALEVWEFDNRSTGGGMMGMPLPHPMHIHGVQFQVLERNGNIYKDGYVDEGWKDTILLQPGENVRLLARFGPYKGMYLYHCHNLEHEDNGMMRNYVVV